MLSLDASLEFVFDSSGVFYLDLFVFSLLRGKDKPNHVQGMSNALSTEGYINISEKANQASLTPSDIQVVKKLQKLED